MKKLIEFDKWLMTQTQRAYLWFFDWTGVYVGTLTFLLTMLFLLVVTGSRLSWFDLVCVVPCSIASMLMYRAQNSVDTRS